MKHIPEHYLCDCHEQIFKKQYDCIVDEAKEKGLRVYGARTRPLPEEISQCITGVWSYGDAFQCQRKRGHGKDGLYCKQHAKSNP